MGGGKTAREYIGYARRLGADESYLDDIGISCSRLNAMLMIAALGENAAPVVAVDFDEALQLGRNYDFVVMGHRHDAGLFKEEGGVFLQIGDWMNKGSFGVYENDEIKLKFYK